MNPEQQRRRLLKRLRDVRTKLLGKPTDNYDRRAAYVGAWNECDQGGEAVSEYELKAEDLDVLIESLRQSPATHFLRGTTAAAMLCDSRASEAQKEQAALEDASDEDRADQCEAAARALSFAAEDIRCLTP